MTRKMKDSKIEWIGAIPSYWKVVPSNLFFYNSSKKVEGNVEQLTASQKYGVISQSRFMKLESQMPVQKRDLSDLKQVDKGDFVISLRSFQGGLEIAQESGGITPAYTVLKEKTKQTYAGYYKYFFKSEMYIQALRGTVLDTIRDGKAIRFSNFSMVPIVLPPLNEQKKIVEVLDEKTKTINNIISDTQQSIEELKKYKQSLITEAVTKGLNRNVGIKDSEIEWIGEMPKEWNLVKVNRLFAIKKNIANQNGYDVLSVTQSGLKVKDITRNEGQMAADYSKYQIVKPKDFVMNHMDLLTGWIDIAAQEGVTSPDYRVFYTKDIELVSIEFYLYVFQICYTNRIFYGLGQGVSNLGRWRLQTDKFLNFYLPLPPINEQQEIVKFLNGKLVEINSMIEQKKDLLGELEQYKKSLIYECVTGKKEM
ncbi:restriction endonuclease subunit S [Bacillus cereus]|uniref:restriction endonuclease subunit S n=1 Tax=Bacillus cereus TaxID=1396 RepID=UPI000BF24EE0|nr:restriction endonuclease subunit S [Bacillus cereus]MEB9818484.1 restriction endonuclease subunit S [Bacillus cereus]MEB9825208.1 restriction endonuclease subunit S [Bacillus cereus]PFU19914.1 restriction endonuclease subunit S [Bacillus cereus]HDR7988993.1 restriction endonuclease subunit S [Bacillus cereus]